VNRKKEKKAKFADARAGRRLMAQGGKREERGALVVEPQT